MGIRNTVGFWIFAGILAAAIATPAGATGNAKTKNLEKHKTSPSGKYQPSLDTLPNVERPGVKKGAPKLTDDEFFRANKIYFERCAG